MNALTELLRPHGLRIAEDARKGSVRAQQVIDLYQLHVDAPNDPAAIALCRASFDGWLKESEERKKTTGGSHV